MISPDITISNHRLRWAVDGMRFTAPLHWIGSRNGHSNRNKQQEDKETQIKNQKKRNHQVEVFRLFRCSTHTHTHSLTHTLTHSLTHTLTHSHTHSLTHSLRRGTMCTVKGSDVRPGVPLASLGLRFFCVAGVGQCALPRGRMYALGFRWRPWVSASFAWQAWDNVHCQGVGCTPRVSAGVPGSPPLLRGRRGTMCTAKGSDVRPGVPLASLGLRLFCVAGVGQCALPRGRMYAPGSAGVPGSPPLLRGRRGTMCTAKGLDVRSGVPLASLGLRLFCVAGVGQCALSRGRMYAPGFRWRPWVSASFAWQAWDNVHCQAHTCSETAYRIIDVECIARAKTLQLNLTGTVKTVPFRGETERITKMM